MTETEIDVRAACRATLTRPLDGREPETSLVLRAIAETPWTGDRETFLATVRANVIAVDRQIAAFGDSLHATTFH